MAEPVTDSTEVDKTSKESVSVEKGELQRAAEPDQCVLKVKTQRQRNTVEFTHSLLGVNEKAADDLHRRRKDSDLEDASFDRTDIAAEIGMDKVLVNHDHGSLTAVTGPHELTVYTVREITLLNAVDWTRPVKTIPRNTTRYSHDSLGHCESSIKKMEKQMRVLIFHTLRADHKCDRDRRAAWTITQCRVNAEKQTSLSKWISKDYHGEVAKFAELSRFR